MKEPTKFVPHDADVLESNVARLIALAFEPEQVAPEFRSRVERAVLERLAERATQPQGAASSPRSSHGQPRPLMWAGALTAAAAALLLWWWPAGAEPTSQDPNGGPRDVLAEQQPSPKNDGLDGNGSGGFESNVSPGAPLRLENDASQEVLADSNGGDRRAVDSESPSDAELDANSTIPADQSALQAEIVWSPDTERTEAFNPQAVAGRAQLIVLPQVALPQVGFPTRHDVEWSTSSTAGVSFTADDLKPGPVRLFLQMPGWPVCVIDDVRLPAGSRLTDLRFELQPGHVLAGRVIDAATGNAISGAEVLSEDDLPLDVSPEGLDIANQLEAPNTQSGTDGAWQLVGLRGPTPLVRIHAPGYAPMWARPTGDVDFEVALQPGASLSGRVLDEAGEARPNSRVVVSQLSEVDGGALHYFDSVDVDAQGQFEVRDLPEGFLVALLFDTSPGQDETPLLFRPVQLNSKRPTEVEFRADRNAHKLVGQALDATGSAAPNLSVYLVRKDAQVATPEWLATVTNAIGEFSFDDVTPGRFDVFTSGSGPQNMAWYGEFEGPELGQTLELTLPNASLEFIGSDAQGRAVGVVAVVFDLDSDEFRGRAVPFGPEAARMAPMPAGRYRADLFPIDGLSAAKRIESIELSAGQSLELTYELEVAAPWTLVVTDNAGTPIAGARLQVFDSGGREFALAEDRVRTDEKGAFTWNAAPPGAWLVRIEAPNHQPLETTVSGDAQQLARFEVALERNP